MRSGFLVIASAVMDRFGIKAALSAGLCKKSIARKFGVSPRTIYRISLKLSWKSVD